jgi:hypothetical protein
MFDTAPTTDPEYQRHTRDRDRRYDQERRHEGDEPRAGYTTGALRGQDGDEKDRQLLLEGKVCVGLLRHEEGGQLM